MSEPARLMDRPGRGYAVVESLPALGKGRACTGLFTTDPRHRPDFERAREARRPVLFRGMVHNRHRAGEAEVQVAVSRVQEERGELTVEFEAHALPYDIP